MSGQGLMLDIYSDVVCPWCYIGKRRLERALHRTDHTRVCVTWRPFQLNPTMPKDGMDRTAYLEAKFGSMDAFTPLEEQMLAAAAAEHLPFELGKIARTPNTLLAHRLIWYAGQQGRQDAAVEALFRGYFLEGEDIGAVPVLVKLAEQAGCARSPVERFLAASEGEAEVEAEEAAGRKLGIRGVPYFVFNHTYGLSGAQPSEVFVSAIERVRGQSCATEESRRR